MRRAAFLLAVGLMVAPSASAQLPTVRYGAVPAYANADINAALGTWRQLRQSDRYGFATYAGFLIANPGWPGETNMRLNAEKAMRIGEHGPTVLAFFGQKAPTTGNGHAQLAMALQAAGRSAEAASAARSAWAAGDLGPEHEQQLYARLGGIFTAADHERRVDGLLFAKKPTDAQRFVGLATPARQPALAARIAMQLRTADAEQRFSQVAGLVGLDAGLLMDRLRYLRAAGSEQAARSLAARPHAFSIRPGDPDRFYEMLLALANGAYRDRQYVTAYNIARQVDDAFPAGTDIAAQPLGIRDKYTSLTWLAGTTALDRNAKPLDAIALFDRYARGGKSLQVLTKGSYWAGRAALAAGQAGTAASYFQRAAAYPELFYGQLALERTGRNVPAPGHAAAVAPNDPARAFFNSNPLVRATRLLDQQGQRQDQALFVRALAESLTDNNQRALAVEMGRQTGRDDLPVWVARAARNNGSMFYVRQAFPVHALAQRASLPSVVNGITRQESSFDRTAVSHAGARGMMQLMPGTAQEQAGKMGYGYDYGRLTSDPAYNVMLGSAYFQRLLNIWGGNVPLAVASYNAGAGNVRKWINANGDPRGNVDVLKWIEAIPFTETKGYVQRVIENSVVYDSLNPSPTPQSAMHVSRYLGKSRPG
ncbi:lytic transglycosylase domain-containing protein [Sphingomonas piscis]|uniref:Lytic transglycosylase domain-containing protein n=1 Tax=Sphingomonas piscis TaxID=2714943 RepID=A0A6G7YSU6_9SPHN|nr:lytic transglycosylase domain-containing protein [Sphingomonas piscis]QIK79810.1 lytic transglycosylase domain-containing protein [Sphingomonas piscis]